MYFNINRDMSRLILFQRNETMTLIQKKIRKLFGRFLFTQFFSFLNNKDKISKKYFNICNKEFLFLKKYLSKKNLNILSIGGGVGGVESMVLSFSDNIKLDLIERNFISSKIKYFWNPEEAYNKLNLSKEFINSNTKNYNNFSICDFNNKNILKKKYDLIFSLYSMDFHYGLETYKNFLLKRSHKKTLFVFDTIRPGDLKFFFRNVKVIKQIKKRIHSSARVVCKEIKK